MNEFKNDLRCSPMRPPMTRAIVLSLLFFLLTVSEGCSGSEENSAKVVGGATYYMRADGKAANKTVATSCSSASTAMSVARHNKESFSPDDVINLCDDGGDYKASIIAPSSGTNGHPVTYKNAEGDTPTIDLSVDVGSSSGWTDKGGGLYRKKGYGRVFWEDDVPLKAATSESCSDGNWYYRIASNLLYYRPTSGTPADHTIRTMWFDANTNAIDLRNKSNITVYGLSINRSGYGIKHGQDLSSPTSPITNIILHDNTITRTFWAIYSDIKSNGVESDVSIYDNYIDYCNSGISAWTNSDTTPGHTQYHTRYSITGNQILNLYSITDTKVWSDALLTSYYYTDHEGISFQDVQDSVISNNTITTSYVKDMTSDEYWCRAIFFYLTNGDTATSGNSVLRNYISGHFYPSIYITTAIDFEGFENNLIAYNIIYYGASNKGQISLSIRATSDNPLTGTNYFVNNTIYNHSVGSGIRISYRMIGNWLFKNNIVYSPSHVFISSDNDNKGLTFEHNIYDTAGSFQVGNSGMTFTQWKNTYGYDTVGSVVADPLFVKSTPSAPSDFMLQGTSAAKWKGTNLGIGALTQDYAGSPVHKPPSIGAYEYK